jgi:hypothetical protein
MTECKLMPPLAPGLGTINCYSKNRTKDTKSRDVTVNTPASHIGISSLKFRPGHHVS